MNPHWEMIYSSTYQHQAELCKAILEQNEIICVLRNNQDSLYKPIGEFELYVPREVLLKAKFILEQNNIE